MYNCCCAACLEAALRCAVSKVRTGVGSNCVAACLLRVLPAPPQVETSVMQAVLRVVGTFVGATIAWALMSDPWSANNPYLVRLVWFGVAWLRRGAGSRQQCQDGILVR
jgi:multidrug transporter EmrE-like cation transporter